jgi:hypothetical protein
VGAVRVHPHKHDGNYPPKRFEDLREASASSVGHRANRHERYRRLRQSTFYPYSWALKYARGCVLDLRVESEMYPIRAVGLQTDFARNDQVPYVDIVATLDAPNGHGCADAESRYHRVRSARSRWIVVTSGRRACWPVRRLRAAI